MLNESQNMYYNKESNLISVTTVAGRYPWVLQKLAYQQENVIYSGEQMQFF